MLFRAYGVCPLHEIMHGSVPTTYSKGPSVQRSLSVLLPVKDVQATLSDSVHEILDVAADCGERFEVLIIDDGSTDATSEVAHELSRHYPQVRMLRHDVPLGREAAIRTGLRRSRGEKVVLRERRSRLHDDRQARTAETGYSPAAPKRSLRTAYSRRIINVWRFQ